MLAGLQANRCGYDNCTMATITIHRAHQLGKQSARSSAEEVAHKLQGELKASYRWEGDVLKLECPGAHGCIRVGEAEVQVEVDLSFLLRPMRGHIERTVNAYLEEFLG